MRPEQTAFDTYLSAVQDHPGISLWTEFTARPPAVAQDLLEEIVQAHTEAWATFSAKTDALPVTKWLNRQLGFKLARDKLFPVRQMSKVAREELHDAYTKQRADYFSQDFKDIDLSQPSVSIKASYQEHRFRRIGRFLQQEPRPFEWQVAVVQALKSYYFDRLPEASVEGRKKTEATLLRLLTALHDSQSLVVNDWVSQSVEGNRLKTVMLSSRITDALERTINNFINSDIDRVFPIKRLDATAEERSFVIQIARLHRRFSWKANPAVIFLLLQIEGIQMPLDMRTIEKICAALRSPQEKH